LAARPVVLAITSDQHVNSTVGLCPGEGVRLDDGGRYEPHKAQIWLWERWLSFWHDVDQLRRRHKAKLVTVYNGDAVDGDHHQTSQIVSRNMEVQGYMVSRVFSIPRDLKPDTAYMVRGTETHVGPSGASEESLARHLQCERDPVTETWSTWHLRLHVHGRLIDCQHHGRTGTRPWTKQNALSALACQIWMEHRLADERHPDLAIRSHRHVHGDSFDAFPTRLIQTPAWQLKTAFAHKVAAESIADVGGVIVVVYPDGQYEVIPKLYRPDRPPIRSVA